VHILKTHAGGPVIALAESCHGGLHFTRGAVMSLAAFDLRHNLLTEELLLLRPGVVGSQVAPLRASVLPVVRGDVLVLAIDGVRSGFALPVTAREAPVQAAQAILDGHNKQTDDALLLVARYQG
jgi:phosphoserine phosphatase RsbX